MAEQTPEQEEAELLEHYRVVRSAAPNNLTYLEFAIRTLAGECSKCAKLAGVFGTPQSARAYSGIYGRLTAMLKALEPA